MSIAADAPKLWLAVQVPSDVNGPLLECWFDMVVVCIVAEQTAAACFVAGGGRAGGNPLVDLLYGWVKFSKSVGHSVGSVERY